MQSLSKCSSCQEAVAEKHSPRSSRQEAGTPAIAAPADNVSQQQREYTHMQVGEQVWVL